MFTFSAFTFANPLALLALLALPAIYWLVRFTPPKPQTVRFAPFRLLRDLISRNEQPDRAPWWLTALRLALAALVIMAIAGPFWNTGAPPLRTGTAPLLIVIDNDWSSAPQWDRRMAVLDEIITAAERAGTPVILAASTPDGKPQALTAQSPANAKKAAAVLAPRALATARPQLARRLVEKFASQKALQIAWLANGIGGTKAENFAKTLKSLAGGKAKVEIFTPAPDHLPVAVSNPMLAKGAFKITVLRPDGNTKSPSSVDILAANGRSLASAKFKFDGNKTSTEVTIKLPLELRNEAARIEVTGARSAGAVYLLDDRWRRKVVGVIAGPSSELAQPLLSPLYYVTRALEPSAALRTASEKTPVTKLIDDGISMLVLADVGAIAPADRAAIGKWLQGGGVLLRFAGPHLARAGALARDDELIPVRLRRGGRSLGSALG
ncbi:MAG TPA: LytTR family transcriptional regulator, partial [Rhizobiales bacterium]|nr:LytTR family transcriptional regulator [Hyphomicrobiales bacterium]